MYLRQYLDRNELTTVEFGKKCGLSQAYIWQIAKGHRRPSPKVAKRIEAATRCVVSVLELMYPEQADDSEPVAARHRPTT
ncbi:MAG: helix-turn-helix transcriptional regulator [Candidatus Latescibacteria bacterium]|mgnify:CR=1 FL=1|nr:helix-turn-helix transcriptional regulator [Candidatus Latescibacterota bacterium]